MTIYRADKEDALFTKNVAFAAGNEQKDLKLGS